MKRKNILPPPQRTDWRKFRVIVRDEKLINQPSREDELYNIRRPHGTKNIEKDGKMAEKMKSRMEMEVTKGIERKHIIEKIESLPDDTLREVLDFIEFLEEKRKREEEKKRRKGSFSRSDRNM